MKISHLIFAIAVLTACGANDNVRIVRGINGVDGKDGLTGPKGEAGERGQEGLNGSNGINGINGSNGKDGVNGIDGTNGATGVAGMDGTDGRDGVDGTNGVDGVKGLDGKDATLSVIDPCGDAPNVIDEVLLIMPNNSILASFSENVEGRNTRFILIPDGTYMTTDGSMCAFTIKNGRLNQ